MHACISTYPGTTNLLIHHGKITLIFNEENNSINYKYSFLNLESNVTGAGTHIHTGTTCHDAALVGGHYWYKGVNETVPDPWTEEFGAVYATDVTGFAKGNFVLTNGYGFQDNLGHVVVVHASDGSRIGCGVLTQTKTKCRHGVHECTGF